MNKRKPSRLVTAVANVLLVLVSLVVALVAGEFVARFAYRDITSTSNLQSWFGERWKSQSVELNPAGFRDQPVSRPKAENVFRVAVLGDSFAYGQGLPVEDRFSDLLRADVPAACGREVEVFNFAQPGAATLRETEVLSETVLALEPDFLLLQWLPNDLTDLRETWYRRPTTPLAFLPGLHRYLSRRSALYYVANEQWQGLMDSFGARQSYAEYMLSLVGEPGSEQFARAREPLLAFSDVAESAGIAYAVVLFPLLSEDPQQGYIMGPAHEMAASVCAERSSQCIDLRDDLRAASPDGTLRALWVNRLDPHPGATANRAAADRLLQEIDWPALQCRTGAGENEAGTGMSQ